MGHSTSISDPVRYHACIQAAWQAAAPLWPAWFEVLEAEEEGVAELTEVSSARPPASANFINPETMHPPFGYRHVVEVTAGRPVYIAGRVALIEVEAVAVIATPQPLA